MESISEVGFTGTRDGMTAEQKEVLKKELSVIIKFHREVNFRHGDCLGADAEAHKIAKKLGFNVIIHPPKVDNLRAFCEGDSYFLPRDYLVRDRDIVHNVDIVYGAPKSKVGNLDKEIVIGSGTLYTIKYAHTLGRKVCIINIDGEIEWLK